MLQYRHYTSKERQRIKEIILEILKKSGPLGHDEIIAEYRKIDTTSYLHDDYVKSVEIKIATQAMFGYKLRVNDSWQWYIG